MRRETRYLLRSVGVPSSASGSSFDPFTLGTPALIWDTVVTDTTPNFDVDLPSGNGVPLDAAVGDVLRLEYQLLSGGAWNAYLTDTLDAGEIAGDPITVTGVTPLAEEDYLFRARLERGAFFGSWSASEPATVA